MSSAARWSIVVIVVVVALAAALWGTIGGSSDGSDGSSDGSGGAGSARESAAGQGEDGASGVTPGPYQAASAQERAEAGIAACPGEAGGDAAAGNADTGAPNLADIPLVCMADGTAGDFAELAGGKPTLVNLWAYWCEPCRRELPELARAQEELGDSARVVLVHSDPAEGKGLAMLRELGITGLPSLEDSEGAVAKAAGAPPVLPVSVLVRPDGSVARVLPQVMNSADDVLAAMEQYLGTGASAGAATGAGATR